MLDANPDARTLLVAGAPPEGFLRALLRFDSVELRARLANATPDVPIFDVKAPDYEEAPTTPPSTLGE